MPTKKIMKNEIRQAFPLTPELEDKTFVMQGEAFLLLEKGLTNEAVDKIKEAWDLLPEPKFNTSCSDTILCQLVETLAQVGRHEEARPILDEWIVDVETCGFRIFDTTPFILSGENYLYASKIEEAKEQFYEAVRHGASKRDFSDRPSFYFDIANKKITGHKEIIRLFEEEILLKPKARVPHEELSDEVIDRIEELSEKGNSHSDEGNYGEAIAVWQRALSLIPHPQHMYAESQWLETSIGDAYFMLNEYKDALVYFQNAMANIEENAYGNPFIMLRLGQILLENQQLEEAKEYLLSAYMLEGAEIFEEDDKKYFEFLEKSVRLE